MSSLSLAVPPELVEALADAVAKRLASADDEGRRELAAAAPSRLALSIAEAAELIGCSGDHFRRHVLPDLRVVRCGRLRMVSVVELERWLDRNAARALEASP